MKKYNVKEIMIQAHDIRKTEGVTMGAALKKAWSVAKIKIGVTPMDSTVQEYFDAKAEFDKAKKRLEAVAGKIQDKCLESPDFCISGFGWKASFKEVTSNRLDSKALKADYADLYAAYTKPQTSRRFLCNPVALYA